MNIVDQAAPTLIDAAKGADESDRLRWRLFGDDHNLGCLWIGETIVP